MVQKKLEKDTTWKCKHGCPNNRTICPHLEKLLPNIDRSQVKLVYKENMDSVLTTSSEITIENELFTRRKLKQLGLDKRDSELFMLKYTDKFTLVEILERYPEYLSVSNIHYALRQIKRKLKERLNGES